MYYYSQNANWTEMMNENHYLNNLIQYYIQQINKLQIENEKLKVERKILREFLEKYTPSIHIANLNMSHDINLEKLRVNSIQSGAALNIAEAITNTTDSDMDMTLGPNSMNNGDHNQMEYDIESLGN